MNKEFLQTIFAQTKGNVYRFLGSVPEGESVSHYITEQFTNLVDNKSMSTVVVELEVYDCIIIYSDSSELPRTNSLFELVTDLVPTVFPEIQPVIVPEPTQEEQ